MKRSIAVALVVVACHTPVGFAADSLVESALLAARALGCVSSQHKTQMEVLGAGARDSVKGGPKLDHGGGGKPDHPAGG